jgi:putative transposase
MEALYQRSGISKQGYFKKLYSQKKRQELETEVIEKVKVNRQQHPQMGSRPLYYLVQPSSMGINKFEELLKVQKLTLEVKRSYIRTTNSNHAYRRYANLVNGRGLNDINQVWVGDITYYITATRVYYITFVEDVYSRRILGHHVSETMHAVEIVKALRDAFKTRKGHCLKGLIHHSDRGGQYCSDLYTGLLNSKSITISMANSCLENSYAERINGTIKNQYLLNKPVSGLHQLRKQVKEAVKLYNYERPHKSLGYSTPEALENTVKKVALAERKIVKMYDFRED